MLDKVLVVLVFIVAPIYIGVHVVLHFIRG
jgi:hypothetical protein